MTTAVSIYRRANRKAIAEAFAAEPHATNSSVADKLGCHVQTVSKVRIELTGEKRTSVVKSGRRVRGQNIIPDMDTFNDYEMVAVWNLEEAKRLIREGHEPFTWDSPIYGPGDDVVVLVKPK